MSHTRSFFLKNTRARVTMQMAIMIIAMIAIVYVGNSLNPKPSIMVNVYLQNGYSATYALNDYGYWLSIELTSTNNYMNVRVVVDNQTVYDRTVRSYVNFQYNMGKQDSQHAIQFIITNPSPLELEAIIMQVSGKASIMPHDSGN